MKFLPALSVLVIPLLQACAGPVEPLPSNNLSSPSIRHASLEANCTTREVTSVAVPGAGYPAPTSFSTIAGRQYQISVSGTYFANAGLYADARYSSRLDGPWQDSPSTYESYGPTLLDMQIWDPSTSAYVSPDWGSYSADHRYSTSWTAVSNQLTFRISDFNAANNSGSLSVTVCEVPPTCIEQQVTAVAPTSGLGYPPPALFPVTTGREYEVTVSGTYFANDGLYADARYSSRFDGPWQEIPNNYESWGPTLLDLQFWDPSTSAYVSPDWGPYTSSHIYSTRWTATSGQLNVRINDYFAGNDSGFLSVAVCEVPPACITQEVTAVAPGGGLAYPPPTSFPAIPGNEYEVTVSGTYFANDGLYADARYSSRFNGPWQEIPNNYESWGPTLLDMQIWDPFASEYLSPDWGPYASSHTYSTRWLALTDELIFRINDYYAGNDSGSLSVTVCPTEVR